MYRQIKLKKGRERSLLNMHPWVFSGAVINIPGYENGEIVEVISSSNEILGYGFFSPGSQIVCRMFEFTDERIQNFNKDYFFEKIKRARLLRKSLIGGDTDCFRLVNAEGDFFPGLIVDIYAGTAVLQILVKGTHLILDWIVRSLEELGYSNICIKSPGDNVVEGVDLSSGFIRGGDKTPIAVKENGHSFIVDPVNGQKTGFFIDQRENRELAGRFSGGRNVLNAFCYTGGFSVYALAGGAALVHSVDISSDAVDLTSENLKRNFSADSNHKEIKADCFEYLRSMENDFYDLVVLDPPAFVKSSKGVERGARGYKDINLCAMKKVKSDSLIFTFSCSHHVTADLFRKIVFSAAADSGRDVRVLAQLSQGKDHPFSIYHPEGEYLKGLFLYIS